MQTEGNNVQTDPVNSKAPVKSAPADSKKKPEAAQK